MPYGRLLLAFLATLIFAALASAEPGTPPGDEIKAVKLDYGDRPGKEGRFAAAEVTVGETPVRYYVRGTNVSAPFSVQVIAASRARPLDVTLHRQNWGKAVQSGSTGSGGSFVFEGRAYGDVGVQLASPGGAPARATLVFWQGEPAPPSMARVYSNPEIAAAAGNGGGEHAGGASEGTSPIFYVIAGLLAVIALFLAVMLVRRNKSGAAAMLLIGGLTMTAVHEPAPAYAQGEELPPPRGAPNPFDVEDPPPIEGARESDKDVTAGKPTEPPNPFDVDKPPPEAARDKDKDATAGRDKDKDKPKDEGPPNPFTGETTTGSGRPIELKPEDFDPSNAPKDEPGASEETPPSDPGPAPVDEGYADRLAEAEGRINELNRQASANRAEIERLRLLVESDREMEPDPSNLPPMPLTCRPPAVENEFDEEMGEAWDNYDACEACYREPLRELDELLINYERLRILYMSTADFVSTAITMGDTVPKPHQFVEMSWAQQKADIQKSFQGTKDAYDAKRAEFNDEMVGVLDELGRCEAEHNNNPMWRTTEAEMFYQTIKASYQRTN